MSESAAHLQLVALLVKWIADSLLNGDHGRIMSDVPNSTKQRKPLMIGGFIPDAFVNSLSGEGFIVGEAKTARDLESRHTIQQFSAFLRKCDEAEGSHFVLAVPWYCVRFTKSIIKYCQVREHLEGVQTTFLDRLPG